MADWILVTLPTLSVLVKNELTRLYDRMPDEQMPEADVVERIVDTADSQFRADVWMCLDLELNGPLEVSTNGRCQVFVRPQMSVGGAPLVTANDDFRGPSHSSRPAAEWVLKCVGDRMFAAVLQAIEDRPIY